MMSPKSGCAEYDILKNLSSTLNMNISSNWKPFLGPELPSKCLGIFIYSVRLYPLFGLSTRWNLPASKLGLRWTHAHREALVFITPVQACGCACALNNCAEVNRGADSPAAAAAVTRLGWKLGAWRRKLGATRTRIRIRVQRGTTSSTLTSSLSSHRNAALSQICALNRSLFVCKPDLCLQFQMTLWLNQKQYIHNHNHQHLFDHKHLHHGFD